MTVRVVAIPALHCLSKKQTRDLDRFFFCLGQQQPGNSAVASELYAMRGQIIGERRDLAGQPGTRTGFFPETAKRESVSGACRPICAEWDALPARVPCPNLPRR